MRWLAIVAIALGAAFSAQAQEKIRVGIIGPFSGPFAAVGAQFRQGIETYVSMHGTKAGDREVELIFRDQSTTNPATAKRLAEELIVRDKVSLIGGLYLSPEATAVAPVANETKTPFVLFVPAAPLVVKQSPFFIRGGSNSLLHAGSQANWALKNNYKRIYVAVSDYAPGHDTQAHIKQIIQAGGGTIVGEDRMPLNTVDYAPFAERIANAKPDALLMFLPNGAPAVSFFKALGAQGVLRSKIGIIGQAETDDPDLKLFDDSIIGVHTAIFYSSLAPYEANRKFKEALAKKSPDLIPGFPTLAAFDGMTLLYRMIDSQKGKAFDGASAMKSVEGFSWESPRGVATIDAATRDMITNIFIRRVEKVDGKLVNRIVDTLTAQKPPAQ
ncbi:MAG: ABC transporter substrate-binding protein [Burkholderiales bacterium]